MGDECFGFRGDKVLIFGCPHVDSRNRRSSSARSGGNPGKLVLRALWLIPQALCNSGMVRAFRVWGLGFGI